ncbi:MAG TPA: hypothetical protein VEZ88_05640 [Steroidobacteraceae bacterium]|nr:hypothetical protein [Steroidobacteraceae bacterium]
MPEISAEPFTSLERLGETDLRRLLVTLSDAMRLQVLRRMQGTVHHDFVSPLQAATLTFDLVRRQLQQPQTDEQREHTYRLIEAGKAELVRLRDGITTVMDTVALSAGERRFDLRETVESLGQWMQNEAAFLGLQLELRCPEEELLFHGPYEDVRQLLALLMLLAIDGLSTGGKLLVDLRKEEAAVRVKLVAEGIKMPERWTRQMFEPSWTDPQSLSGLGPCVALFTAAALGGTIDVESTAAQTALLQLRLPLTS